MSRPCQKTAVFLLCDIQEKFREHIWSFANVANTATKMIAASQILQIPCIATEQNPKGLGPLVPEIPREKLELIEPKTKFSMWIPTVQQWFSNNSTRKNVVLFGIESHVCITQTALDLLSNNYNVYIVADGVSSMNKKEVPIALERLRKCGATISTSDSILFEILGDASHKDFKQISALVKQYKQQTTDALNALVE